MKENGFTVCFQYCYTTLNIVYKLNFKLKIDKTYKNVYVQKPGNIKKKPERSFSKTSGGLCKLI